MAGEWDERTGIEEVDDALSPLGRKRRLSSIMSDDPGNLTPAHDSSVAVAPRPQDHRIADDMQTGNRSGGPAGGYQDPGQGRLADLMKQREALNAPAKKPSLVSQLGRLATQIVPVALAAKFGGMGGTIGAEKGVEEGIQRRHQVEDLEKRNKREDQVRLDEAIEAENRAAEQRTYQHGEDEERLRVQEEGMTARQKLSEEMETARADRLATTIAAQGQRQQAGFEHQDELENLKESNREDLESRKQVGRMQLEHAKAQAQMAIAQWKSAHPSQNIPPMLGKVFSKYQDSQSRMDLMQKAYDDAIRDPGNQQAMMLMLTNHIGMTMGAQSGARITQTILDEAQRSGYLTERIDAHFGPDGVLTGVVLTPRQMRQMMPLAESKLMEDARAVTDTESYFGVQGHAPISPRVPGAKAQGGAGGGAGGPGAPNASTPADIPPPPRDPDPGMKWQYNPKTKQFRETPIIAK